MTKNISGAAAEKKDDSGKVIDLKAARESLGLTLEDIFRQTRISVNNLQAIETQDFQSLPPPVYSRTFIRQYARVLSVDEKKLIDQYERYLDTHKTPPSLSPETEKRAKIAGINYRIFAALISVSVAVAIIIFLTLYRTSNVDIPHNPLPPQKSPTAVTQESPRPPSSEPPAREAKDTIPEALPASPVPKSTPSAEIKPPAEPQTLAGARDDAPIILAGTPYRISIEARERTWLQIRSDQAPAFQVLLNEGEKMEREIGSPFILDIGNAGGADVQFQGKPLGRLGASGEVVHLKLP